MIVVKTVVQIKVMSPVIAELIITIAKDGDELMSASLGVMEAVTLVLMVSIALETLTLASHEHPSVATRIPAVISRLCVCVYI